MSKTRKRTFQDINDVSWLRKPHVHIKDPEKVIEKINNIVCGGKEKLQVIFDFDRTLTKSQENGVVTQSSFGMLESLPTVPKDLKDHMNIRTAKYLPIEIDPNLTLEEKIPHMLEWWKLGFDEMVGLEWDPNFVDECLRRKQLPFRDGTNECFQKIHRAGVPVLVFSAGIGDVVRSLLKHQGLLTSNVHIFSNFFKIENGKIAGCIGDLIHVFNKNEHLLENSPYFEELAGRSNVILLGDSIGDAKMSDGVPHDAVLKIGFLNSHIEEYLAQYLDLFDIVLADDQTMDILRNILNFAL